jgi:hypothetical protein
MNIQLEHKDQRFSCEIFSNEKLIHKFGRSNLHEFQINELPDHIKIYINPYKLKPIIRFDGMMVNYGLAGITPWDHMLEINLQENFFDRYFDNIITSKQQYLNVDTKTINEKLGLVQLTDLINKIKGNLK